MKKGMQQVGRLAMRQEGEQWNAYYAKPNTMDGAVFLGSIRLRAIQTNEKRKEAFMAMMRDIVADYIEEATGLRPEWGGLKVAPEHERAGNG